MKQYIHPSTYLVAKIFLYILIGFIFFTTTTYASVSDPGVPVNSPASLIESFRNTWCWFFRCAKPVIPSIPQPVVSSTPYPPEPELEMTSPEPSPEPQKIVERIIREITHEIIREVPIVNPIINTPGQNINVPDPRVAELEKRFLVYDKALSDQVRTIALTNRIGQLQAVNFTAAAFSGTQNSFNLTDADIPDTITASNYMLLGGSTMTGSLSFTGRSTTTIPNLLTNAYSIATSSSSEVPFLTFDTLNSRIGIGTTSPGSTFSIQSIANFSAATSTIYSNLAVKGLLNIEANTGFAGTINGVQTANRSYTLPDQSGVLPAFPNYQTSNNILRIGHSFNNFLSNSSFEFWYQGTSAAPSDWTLQGATAARSTSGDSSAGSYSAVLSFTAADDQIRRTFGANAAVAYTYSLYAKRTSGSGSANLVAQQDSGSFTEYVSNGCTASTSFTLCQITFTKPDDGVNTVRFAFKSQSSTATTWQIDEAMIQEGSSFATAWLPSFLDDTSAGQTVYGSKNFASGVNFATLDNSSAGFVGMATTSPGSRLSVQGNAQITGTTTASALMATSTLMVGGTTGSSLYVGQNGNVGIGTTSPSLGLFSVSSTGGNSAYFAGNVGMGVASPSYALHIAKSDSSANPHIFELQNNASGGGQVYMGVGATGASVAAGSFYIADNGGYRFIINTSNGNVGIGTTTPGTILSISGASGILSEGSLVIWNGATQRDALIRNGAICADNNGTVKCQASLTAGTVYGDASSFASSDVAENYPVADVSIEEGDIVMVASSLTNEEQIKRANDKQKLRKDHKENPPSILESLSGSVAKANQENGKNAIGVISTKPGVLLGDITGFNLETSFKPVALVGRVPVKVSMENGPIIAGDYIALSSVPGVGAKAVHSQMTVGMALESFVGPGFGKILAFINFGYSKIDSEIDKIKNSEADSDINNMWRIDPNGRVSAQFSGGLDLSGNELRNLSRIISSNGLWSIDENGKLVIKEIETGTLKAKNATFGSGEKPYGFTIYDQSTKEPYCVGINNGAWVNVLGECHTNSDNDQIPRSLPALLPSAPLESTPIVSGTKISSQGENHVSPSGSGMGDGEGDVTIVPSPAPSSASSDESIIIDTK